jgi:hypothetical protein
MTRCWLILAIPVFVLAGFRPAHADDSAASKAAGGIVLVHEPRISMESEKLTIGPTSKPHDPNIYFRVTVEYEFLNHSNHAITTEVGFPVPPYSARENVTAAGMRDFDDFRLWVNGKPREYGIDARAFLHGRDVTGIVRSFGLDVASLGHLDSSAPGPYGSSPQVAALSAAVKKRLSDLGLVDLDYNAPLWTVKKIYYWQQIFPAHAVVRVRHEYTAAEGFEEIEPALFDPSGQAKALAQYKQEAAKNPHANLYEPTDEISNIRESCVDPSLQAKLAKTARSQEGYVQTFWVDFILTTANNWQTPIRSFELDLQKLPGPDSQVSVCWNGPIERVDATRYRMTARDFVPKRDLHILFLQ